MKGIRLENRGLLIGGNSKVILWIFIGIYYVLSIGIRVVGNRIEK